jgi:hypothetical protein
MQGFPNAYFPDFARPFREKAAEMPLLVSRVVKADVVRCSKPRFVVPGRTSCPGRVAACNAATQSRDLRRDNGPRIGGAPLSRCAASGERVSVIARRKATGCVAHNDLTHTFAFSRHALPEFCASHRLLETGGRRESRVIQFTRSLVRKDGKHTS